MKTAITKYCAGSLAAQGEEAERVSRSGTLLLVQVMYCIKLQYMCETTKTLKLRIKYKHQAVRERHKFLSGYDLQKLTDGFSKCDGVAIGSATTQQVCEEYATRRRQFKRARLNGRVSNPKSSRRSLGWMSTVTRRHRSFIIIAIRFKKMLSFWLPGTKIYVTGN